MRIDPEQEGNYRKLHALRAWRQRLAELETCDQPLIYGNNYSRGDDVILFSFFTRCDDTPAPPGSPSDTGRPARSDDSMPGGDQASDDTVPTEDTPNDPQD